MYNDSSVAVTISWDGVNDHDYLPSKGFWLYDASANREVSDILEVPANTQFYVKGSAGTASVYLTILYGR